VVVDGKMQVLPADATAVALPCAIPGDAVAYAVEAAKLLAMLYFANPPCRMIVCVLF
jgi:hypothetical protein